MARWQRPVSFPACGTHGLTMAPMIGQDVGSGGWRFYMLLIALAALAVLVFRYL